MRVNAWPIHIWIISKTCRSSGKQNFKKNHLKGRAPHLSTFSVISYMVVPTVTTATIKGGKNMKVPCFLCGTRFLRWLAIYSILIWSCLPAPAAPNSGDTKPTSTTAAQSRPVVEECQRCHDVVMYQRELQSSAHAFDKDKKEISCEQCHHFHYSPLTSYYARDKYYDKKIFPPGAFKRRKMQVTARKSMQAAKCQACHKDLYKNTKGEPLSEIGKLCHDAYLGKNGETRRTCAGCHINIAHLPPFDRDQSHNKAFAKKLAKKEGQSK